MKSEENAGKRARRRGTWPVRVYRLGEEPSDSLLSSTTAEERLAMMWPLAVEAWTLAGNPLSVAPRAEMPVCVRRLRASD